LARHVSAERVLREAGSAEDREMPEDEGHLRDTDRTRHDQRSPPAIWSRARFVDRDERRALREHEESSGELQLRRDGREGSTPRERSPRRPSVRQLDRAHEQKRARADRHRGGGIVERSGEVRPESLLCEEAERERDRRPDAPPAERQERQPYDVTG